MSASSIPSHLEEHERNRKASLLQQCVSKAKFQRQRSIFASRSTSPALLLATLQENRNDYCEINYASRTIDSGNSRYMSEEDEIMELLGGDRDLYINLMADLEEALYQDILEEEAAEKERRDIIDLETWEAQKQNEDRQEILNYELYEHQLAACMAHDSSSDEQNCSMQVLMNEDSKSSIISSYNVCGAEDNLMHAYDEVNSRFSENDDVEIDYLVCPICKRNCMELRRHARLAECSCSASLYIGRDRCLQTAEKIGRLPTVTALGPGYLTIREIKAVVSQAMDIHGALCAPGYPVSIDCVEFSLVNLKIVESSEYHPHLFFMCTRCGAKEFVL
jgi:hypothetical protein